MKFVARQDVRALLRETLGGKFSIVPIANGLLNQNLLVTTAAGTKFVFKAYRPEMPREKVDETHRIMEHAARRGIPVPLPIATYVVDDHVAALYLFVEGEHPSRDGVGIRRVEAMGEMIGRVERAIESFKPLAPKPPSLSIAYWNPDVLANEMSAIRSSLRRKPRRMKEDVEQTLAAYETILSAGDWSKERFAKLPVRVCHNDFHTQNILMRGDSVVAVLDWEKAGWDWRGYELFRSVMFNCRGGRQSLDWRLVGAYVRGCRKFVAFTALERALAFDCGFTKAFFSLWAARQYVAGHDEWRDNMFRRARALPYLFKNRAEFAQRIDNLLRST